MTYGEVVETIILVGVIWNSILQTVWFILDREKKHGDTG